MSIDGAAADTVQSFELTGSPQVVSLNPVIHKAERDDESDERRRGHRNNHECETRLGQVDEQHVESASQDLVNAVDVTIFDKKASRVSVKSLE